MSAPTIPLTGTAYLPNGNPAAGLQVTLEPFRTITTVDGEQVTDEITITLDDTGSIPDGTLIVPSDADIDDVVPYFVQELYGSYRSGYVSPLAALTTFNLFAAGYDGYTPPDVPTPFATQVALESEAARAEAAEALKANLTDLTAEAATRSAADSAEAAARIAADTALASSVTNETSRAEGIEATIQAAVDAINAALPATAPLAGPNFTGSPTAPTPTGGDNSTRLATTAFVKQTVDGVVDGAPAALDTLKELADALGDDANYAATITTALAGKQPLDADLTAIAALDSSTAGALVTDGSGWLRKPYAQLKTALALVKADVGLGNVDNTADSVKAFTESQVTNLVADLAAKMAQGSLFINPMDTAYNAKGDWQENGDASATASTNVITSVASSAQWQEASPVGKIIMLQGAGGAMLYSTVTAYDPVGSPTQVTIADLVGTTVSSASVAWGSDDTTALDAAFAAARAARGATVMLPAGHGFYYNGNGTLSAEPKITTFAYASATVYLGAGKSLVTNPDSSTGIKSLYVTNVRTFGGYGLVRLNFTGAQSSTTAKRVDGFRCDFPTGAAVSSLASDDAFWRIDGVVKANNGDSTIGVALAGLADDSWIHVECTGCRIDVKLGLPGNARVSGVHIAGTYMGFPRIPIWVVPSQTGNYGQGLVINKFKFGNENQNVNDYRILYADQDTSAGTDFSNYLPSWAASSGMIAGHVVRDCGVIGAQAIPVVYSTTPNVEGCDYAITCWGTNPSYFLQYLTPPAAGRENQTNRFDAISAAGSFGIDTPPFPISNDLGSSGHLNDPMNLLAAQASEPLALPGAGDPVGYVSLLPSNVAAATLSNATTAALADAYKGSDAAEITFTGSTGFASLALTAPTVGVPVWVEFDMQTGLSSPQASIQVETRYTSNGTVHWRRMVSPGAGWRRYRFKWTPREATTTILLYFRVPSSVTPGSVGIGRVRVYHAYEPVNVDGQTARGLLVVGNPDRFAISNGEATLAREAPTTNTLTLSSGVLRLTYLSAFKTETINNVKVWSGSTASGSPTHCFVGVYSEDASGNLTLVGQTADDTTIFASINSLYTRALTAPFTKTAGVRYAVGHLVVATTMPTLMGSNPMAGQSVAAGLLAAAPRKTGAYGSALSALPSSITSGIVGVVGVPYAEITP